MNGKNISFVVYDTETGGLKEDKNPILEISMIPIVRNLKGVLELDLESSVDSLILEYDKKLKIEDAALNANGLTLKLIKKCGNEAKLVIEVIKELCEYLNPGNSERYRPILVGHNIHKFDNKFLEEFFKFNDGNSFEKYFNVSSIDTYTMARHMLEGSEKLQNLKLTTLCSYFNIELINAHRAYNDALANAKLFLKWNKITEMNRREILKLK